MNSKLLGKNAKSANTSFLRIGIRGPMGFVSTLLLITCSFASWAQDKSKEIDIIYAKLISEMPVESSLIAVPYADSINHFGDIASGKLNPNSDAVGGAAYEIDIKQAGRQPYDAGAYMTIGGEIKKGDVVFVLFFARLLSEEGGDIRQVALQLSQSPYTASFSKRFDITTQWASYTFAGKAHTDFANNESQISFQLAAQKQRIALGPVYVLNLGNEVDIKDLPFLD
ncbi:MAG: hypothetical protein Alis3KO_12860 [Aliiglaciecola sp.]